MSSVSPTVDVLTHIDGDATLGAGWSFSSPGILSYTSNGTDSTATLPTNTIYEDRVYELHYNVTNTALQASDTSVVVQIGGGGDYSFTEDQVWDGTAPNYQICGSSVGSGVQLSSVNSTAGDRMDIEVVVCLVTQFEDSTNLGAVFVSMDGRVPATSDLVTDGDMSNPASWIEGNGASIGSGVCTLPNTASFIRQSSILSPYKTYLIFVDINTLAGGDVIRAYFESTSDGFLEFNSTGAKSGTLLSVNALDDEITIIKSGANGSAEVDNVAVYELTAGPIDEYPQDILTDYSGAPGALAGDGFGIYRGEKVYISTNKHAPGDGSADVNYYVRIRNNTFWYITAGSALVSDTPTEPLWFGANLIGDYSNGTMATGVATVTYGPVDGQVGGGIRGRINGGGRYAGFRRSRYN